MTALHFRELLNRASVRLVHGREPGLFLQGITQEELSEIITIAGQALGEIRKDAKLNPEWLNEDLKDIRFI